MRILNIRHKFDQKKKREKIQVGFKFPDQYFCQNAVLRIEKGDGVW